MKTRRNRTRSRTRKQRGGYEAMGQPLGYVDPKWNAPNASAGMNVQGATQTIVRQPLNATPMSGGKRRKTRGGFYPTIMSGVVSNAPFLFPVAARQGLELFSQYRKGRTSRKSRKTRRGNRKH